MKDNIYYAVVDLEATGNQFNQGNRVIQFGCTLVQNGKILETIDILINPERQIPYNIEQLTGISNQQVKKAPLFYEVANYIRGLLQDTVFVAHNASFDFRLLNEELKRVGVPELKCRVIDTVDLSRILLPRQDSYTLSDLSQAMELNLVDAHDAGDDSYATAELFLHLYKRASQLPKITVQKLLDITKILNFQTYSFFQVVLDYYDDDKISDDDYVVVNGLVLREYRKDTTFNYRQNKHYPHTTDEKQTLYQGRYQTRPVQEKMMNIVYDSFSGTSNEKHVAIEAVAGSGKSMGYLLPLFYLATPEKQAIISTYTTTLQQQLLEKDIAELRELTSFEIPVVLLKGRNHYIDLEQFHYVLNDGPMDKSRCIYLGKILVWLTETTTGDLDEIFTNSQRLPILQEIRTMKSYDMLNMSEWAPYQFYLKALKEAENAAIVITNHAFLVSDMRNDIRHLPDAEYLVIDESHHLPDIVQESARKSFSTKSFKAVVGNYQNTLRDKLAAYIENAENEDLTHIYQLFESNLTYTMYELPKLEETFVKDMSQTDLSKVESVSIYSDDILSRTIRQTQKWYGILNEMTEQAIQTIQIFENQFQLLNPTERALVDEWYAVVENLFEFNQSLGELINSLKESNNQIWVVMQQEHTSYSVSFETFATEDLDIFKEVMGAVPYVLYTSGTLAVPQIDQLYGSQLDTQKITEYHLDSPYDYAKQTRVIVPEKLPSIKEMSAEAYDMWLADSVGQIAKQMNKSILVLFNSLNSLEMVYGHLQSFDYLSDRLILAQNISGTKHRMLKYFSRSSNAILLGADTFWEGIDLPGDSLEIIVITRLPFESPEKPAVKSRQERLKELGKNPFVYDALPRAQLKFKQGFGRLIRSIDDNGLLFVLDNRFIDANYAKNFQNILPKGTLIESVDFEDLGSFDDYFNED